MGLIFYYSFSLPWFLVTVIRNLEMTLFSLLIIKAGNNQPTEIKNKDLYKICGILNILAIIITLTIPRFYFDPFTLQDYQTYKLLLTLTWSISPLVILISLGIFFVIIGVKNRDQNDIFMIWGGIYMIIAGTCNIIYNVIYLHFILDYYYFYPTIPITNSPMWVVYQTFNQLSITAYILGIVFFIIHGRENKDKIFFYAIIVLIIFHATYWPLNILFYQLFPVN